MDADDYHGNSILGFGESTFLLCHHTRIMHYESLTLMTLSSRLCNTRVDTAGAQPAIIVGLELDHVAAALVRVAVMVREKVDELTLSGLSADGVAVEDDSAGLAGKVVRGD